MLEEHAANAVLENQQVEHDQIDQFDSVEKQVFEQRMLEMESLLRAVVHENTNLRARLEGLEVQNEMQNPPVAVEEIAIPPVHHHTSSSVQKHDKLPKPPVKQMSAVHSDE
mgnify:CR=1 FL=1